MHMTNDTSRNLSLGDAADAFLSGLPAAEAESNHQEVFRFVRWFGGERPLLELAPPAVASYAEQLSLSDTDYARKLDLVRAFLAHAKKAGWVKTNMAVHLKAKKGKTRGVTSSLRDVPKTVLLTPEGYAALEAELAGLKIKRVRAIDEVHKAAADKDFRENAPLEAAREQRGHLEGRIKELEEALKLAEVIDEKRGTGHKVSIGDSIILHDIASGEELRYMIVSPREVDPSKGKISSASPLGKAVIGRVRGDTLELKVPVGVLRYQIKSIEK